MRRIDIRIAGSCMAPFGVDACINQTCSKVYISGANFSSDF